MIVKHDEPIDIETLSGPMRTYIFRPVADGKYPGILFFSDIFQITEPIRRIAAMLAGHGFLVIAPEIFHEFEPPGAALSYLDTEGRKRGDEHKVTKELSQYDTDARSALDYLDSNPHCTGKKGAIGMSVGGHLALRAATNSDVSAAVCFYATDIHKHSLGKGMNDDTLVRIGEIKSELLMIWGRKDPHIPWEGRTDIYKALTTSKVIFQWLELDGGHAFIRDDDTYFHTQHSERSRYDPALTQICFSMVLELFKRRLS